MHHAVIDRSTSTPLKGSRELPRYSARTTLAILAVGSIGSWSLIIMGFRALI